MKIYHNPRCRKSRETLAIIHQKDIQVEIIEYLTNVPSSSELKEIIIKLNISPFELIRRVEKDFKDNYKGKELSDEEWIEAMIKYPKLIERPIVVKEDRAVLGRPPENVLELI